jgi:hypothetical protein
MLSMKRLIACAFGIVIAVSTHAAAPPWVEQGPGPILQGQTEGLPGNPVAGSINALAVDLAHPGVIYAGTTNGGVWKTANANSADPAWVPLTDQQLPALSINSVAISPLNSNVIFAGTGSTSSFGFDGSPGFGVARSANGGTTWSVLATETFAGRRINSIVPTGLTSGGLAGQVVLAATLFDGGGVYRSTNGGASFTRISGTAGLPDAGVSSLVPNPADPSRLYAAVPATFGTGAGVYRSGDGGLTWTAASTGLSAAASSQRILLAVSRNTGVLYALIISTDGSLGGVFRSANAGTTWTSMGAPSPTILPGRQGLLHAAIAADPANPNVVYVAGDRQDVPLPNANGCNDFSANTFRGDASLASPWQSVVCDGALGTSPHADARDMDFDSNGNLLQSNDGGIYLLNNPNSPIRQWSSLNGNVRPTEIHSVAYDAVSNIVFGGTQDTGTPMQNSAGSFTWTEFLRGDGGVVAVDNISTPGTASTRYTSFQFLGFFNRSSWDASNNLVSGPTPLALQIVSGSGAGETLYQFDPTIQFYNPYVLNAIDPSRMLIGTANIYESRDRGDTLNNLGSTGSAVISLAYGGRLNGVPKPDVFYVGTQISPYIWHRAALPGAVTTLDAYPGSAVRDLVMDPQDIRKVYVVDVINRVWASFDEGATWRNLTANLPSLLGDARSIEVFSPDSGIRNTVLLIGGLGGVFQMPRPGAAGTSWIPLSSNLPHGLVLDLHYNYTDNVLVAGILGRGAWTLTGFFRGGGGGSTLATVAPVTRGASASAQGKQLPLRLPGTLPNAPPISYPR